MALTDKALYNIAEETFFDIALSFLSLTPIMRRKIFLNKINSITISKHGTEFVIHVPEEYDYRFSSTH